MREQNIQAIKDALSIGEVDYKVSPSGREIVFGKKKIKVNHNGRYHWTIRVPGTYASDGIRLQFGAKVAVENGLFIIEDVIAIKYD